VHDRASRYGYHRDPLGRDHEPAEREFGWRRAERGGCPSALLQLQHRVKITVMLVPRVSPKITQNQFHTSDDRSGGSPVAAHSRSPTPRVPAGRTTGSVPPSKRASFAWREATRRPRR